MCWCVVEPDSMREIHLVAMLSPLLFGEQQSMALFVTHSKHTPLQQTTGGHCSYSWVLGEDVVGSICPRESYRWGSSIVPSLYTRCSLVWLSSRWVFTLTTPICLQCSTHTGAEGFSSESEQEEVRKVERQLKSRFPIGSQVSEQRIIQDFLRQKYSEHAIQTVLVVMLRRGELQHRMQRKVLFRVRW